MGCLARPAVRAARIRCAAGTAFFYTWLYNRTQSVLLCILLHGSFTAAQDHLLLAADSPVVDAVLFGSYLVAAGVLVALTRGRLGLPRQQDTSRGAAVHGRR
jgi:uncharacterized protein